MQNDTSKNKKSVNREHSSHRPSELELSATMRMPKLTGKIVLFDIDDTITYGVPRTEPRSDNVFLKALLEAMMDVHGLNPDKALEIIFREFDPYNEDVSKHLETLNVDRRTYWRYLLPQVRRSVGVYPDAVETVRELHGRGWRLFTATTNGRMACLAKLAVGGLADQDGSAYFEDVFGGSDVVPDGKSGPHFFRAVLKRIGAWPNEVIHVGDHPDNDLVNALEAGIRQVVLPRRNQQENWRVEPDGGIYVRSLTVLSRLLGRPSQ